MRSKDRKKVKWQTPPSKPSLPCKPPYHLPIFVSRRCIDDVIFISLPKLVGCCCVGCCIQPAAVPASRGRHVDAALLGRRRGRRRRRRRQRLKQRWRVEGERGNTCQTVALAHSDSTPTLRSKAEARARCCWATYPAFSAFLAPRIERT